jgi:hypothetical protein
MDNVSSQMSQATKRLAALRDNRMVVDGLMAGG